MGWDIIQGNGFVLKFSKFLRLFQSEHLHGIQNDAIALLRCRLSGFPFDDHPDLKRKFDERMQVIESAVSIESVRDILGSLVKEHLPQDKEESYIFPEWDDDEHWPWMELIRCCSRVVLPLEPSAVRIFRSPRINGYDVPIGRPVLVFNYDDCFVQRMTAGGKALARTLRQSAISPMEWTDLSY